MLVSAGFGWFRFRLPPRLGRRHRALRGGGRQPLGQPAALRHGTGGATSWRRQPPPPPPPPIGSRARGGGGGGGGGGGRGGRGGGTDWASLRKDARTDPTLTLLLLPAAVDMQLRCEWFKGSLAAGSDGALYCAPWNASEGVLRVDAATQSVSVLPLPAEVHAK
eukprot:SAG31_NODE_4968_length_2828_cov_2.448882_3_plen_164_part_00